MLTFHSKEHGVDTAYCTFRENIARGYTIEQIQEVLANRDTDPTDISSGLGRLLFTVTAFIKHREKEGFNTTQTQVYLLERGYTIEVIKLAYLKYQHTHH